MTSPLLEGTTALHDLEDARRVTGHGPRLRAMRVAAERLAERFAAGPRAVGVRTLPLTTLLYPTKYAFNAAALSPAPYVVLTHRCVLVQTLQGGALRTILFNPSDVAAARATPYFARLIEQFGERTTNLLVTQHEPIETQLARLGISPADVDYVAYDHFHTQDLRPILGTQDGARAARFPNAVLLAPAREWEDWDDLHPYQRAWFVRDGKRGVVTERVALTASDLALGDGVMLVQTPGHTTGNQTLFINTDHGVWGISENGTCADNWSPLDSRIPGLAAMCRRNELDVVINANTPELGAEQYTSMIVERTIASRVDRAPAFVQMFPSSEVTPSALAPGLAPTLLHRAITWGEIARPPARAAADAA